MNKWHDMTHIDSQIKFSIIIISLVSIHLLKTLTTMIFLYRVNTLYLRSLLPPLWARISLTPGQSCCPPAWPQCGGQRGRTAPSASAPRSHKLGVWWCHRPAGLQLHLCNTCWEEIDFMVTFRYLFMNLLARSCLFTHLKITEQHYHHLVQPNCQENLKHYTFIRWKLFQQQCD